MSSSQPTCLSLISTARHRPRLTPIAASLALLMMTASPVLAQRGGGAAWFAAQGEARQMQPRAPVGVPGLGSASDQARVQQQLNRSVANLGRTAAAIAAQQAAQAAARAAASQDTSVVDGYAKGGLWDKDAAGNELVWTGADRAVVTRDGERHNVSIKQTQARAVLNWDSFNIGRNTTLSFDQQSTDAVLNRVVGADARPSQIQGALKGAGTIMVVNQNGVVFSGSSQVNVRNLVVAAAKIDDQQFKDKGLFVDAEGSAPTFTQALGRIEVQRGASITTQAPASVTQDGGYVMLLGHEVSNAGQIITPSGQTVLAAGDAFYIRKGVGTAGNTQSSTRGNEVGVRIDAGSTAGRVSNSGLISAPTGDISLNGREITQAGVLVASTSVDKRGTIHLANRLSDEAGRITLADGAVTAILVDDSAATALDSQRGAALQQLASNGNTGGVFDHLSSQPDRTDLSRVEIVSGNTVDFASGSLTLATGGQIVIDARQRTLLDSGAELDVAGAIGVKVAMASNNLLINVQGFEQRDAPVNRDGKALNNSDVWLDRRSLVLVPAGTNGYATDRWYTAGGLLEVSGYLATSGRGTGEWLAQGGAVTVNGGDFVSRAGSNVNVSGGTLDVQAGMLKQTWLRGADGRLYEVSRAPGDLLYQGIYKGYEDSHARWGQTNYYHSALFNAPQRYEAAYTVGRDAGQLVVATRSAVLEGSITGEVYRGERQTQAASFGVDGYNQSHNSLSRRGQLVIGNYLPVFNPQTGVLSYALRASADEVAVRDGLTALAAGIELDSPVQADRVGKLVLDGAMLRREQLGALRVAASGSITIDAPLEVAHGGEVTLYAGRVDINHDITARAGLIQAGDRLEMPKAAYVPVQPAIPAGVTPGVNLKGALDTRGLQGDVRDDPAGQALMAWRNGGAVQLLSSGDLALAAGSLIDVSGGAAVLADGSLHGGRGGSVHLGAGMGLETGRGRLVLDGKIRGFGVTGGGKLKIESGSAIVIGGKVLAQDGVLGAGETSVLDLVLDETYTVRHGEVLPVDYSYEVTVALPGEALGTVPAYSPDVRYTLAADWLTPVPVSGSYNLYAVDAQGRTERWLISRSDYRHFDADGNPGPYIQGTPTIPAGKVVYFGDAQFPVSYVVPAAVFPDGLQLAVPKTKTVTAGQLAPLDLTLARGTLLTAGAVLARAAKVEAPTELDASLLQTGFGSYAISARNGLQVLDGTRVDAAQPALRFVEGAGLQPGGILLESWIAPLYTADPGSRTLTQRQGADLSLTGSAGLYVGEGALLQVDPGHDLSLASDWGSIAVDGTLRARSGQIHLYGAGSQGNGASDAAPVDLTVQLGSKAVLDASAERMLATDTLGRTYGKLGSGGRILIGGSLDESGSKASASFAFVDIRPGALVDASGTSAWLDPDGQGSRFIATDGGSIDLASYSGLNLNGSLRAMAGGAGASGGRLAVALEAPEYALATARNEVLVPRELVVTQFYAGDEQTLRYGQGRLGVNQIAAGGFSSLALLSNGSIAFDGDVQLAMGRDLRLYSGALTVADQTPATGRVELSAPYVLLSGIANVGARDGYARPSAAGGASTLATDARLLVQGQLIDVRGDVTLGLNSSLSQTTGNLPVERAGFKMAELNSAGDLRFLNGALGASEEGARLQSSGDMTLRAAQIYPDTGVLAVVRAGITATGYRDDGRLVIDRNGAAPELPYSVFGSLTLGAAQIEQGGVLRAPLGTITLGTDGIQGQTQSVLLRPGSITSVSAAGLIMPYGGTTDGITYQYQGKEVVFRGVGDRNQGSLLVNAQNVDAQAGAVLDLSGGGELLGAGFVSGRGGSSDARYTPLIQVGNKGFTLPGLDSNPVYAIVPGYRSAYAPGGGGLIGQQVTIGAGVPGLAAGTYTLLPAEFALLPGAFRVELNGAGAATRSAAAAMRNGSYAASGRLSTANTALQASLDSNLVITPSAVMRSYSQYIETSYADFARADALRKGVPRPLLPADAKQLVFTMLPAQDTSWRFDGQVNFAAAPGGYGGTAVLTSNGVGGVGGQAIEILGSGAAPTAGFGGLSVYADDLNRLGAASLAIGGSLISNYQASGNFLDFQVGVGDIVMRSGAVLRAPQVLLLTNRSDGAIVLEAGSGINTIGQGRVAYDSTDGYVYRPNLDGQERAGLLAVSNGWLDVLAPGSAEGWGPGRIDIGQCAAVCQGVTELYSEGTIAAVTDRDFSLGTQVRYGTRNLVLGVRTVNVGSAQALADAAARGALTAGLTLDQALLERLLQGDEAHGAPGLERLLLTTGDSINFFESASLNTLDPVTGRSRLSNLVLSTPAIYGYGGAGDTASITTQRLTWAGLAGAAPAPVTGGRGSGSGTLRIDADLIEFGFGPSAQPGNIEQYQRLALGFGTVELAATQGITANHKGGLSVYQRQEAGENGPVYHGGNLILSTPLLTGEAGSVNQLRAGGDLRLVGGAVPGMTDIATGAEVLLEARGTVQVAGAIVLPSGKLTLRAGGDVLLTDSAQLDLAGRAVSFFDDAAATQYTWGGSLILESTGGAIRQAAGSSIDLSAVNNHAGSLRAVALDGAAGAVDLLGRILGQAEGVYDAGGTVLPFKAASLDVHAQHLGSAGSLSADFAALNQRLNEGDVTGARAFQFKQGDLVVGSDLRAGDINLSVDGGHLTVNGLVDASGARVGSIRLAGKQGLTLGSTAVLDAHGTILRVDSRGAIIDSPNRALIELASGDGVLTLQSGARMDLRHGTAAGQANDGRERGSLILNAPRLDADGQANTVAAREFGDIAIDASGELVISGARSIAINAVQRYSGSDVPTAADKNADGAEYQYIDQAWLKLRHEESDRFIDNALNNGALMDGKLAALRRYDDALHLRPGVEVATQGELTLQGDLDLSGYRYNSINPRWNRTTLAGSGEVGDLVIRAGGGLNVYGNINDGFTAPETTVDTDGWSLVPGVQPFGGDLVLPRAGVRLEEGTVYPAGRTLNYDITAGNVTLPAGTLLPAAITLDAPLALAAGTVLTSHVTAADGTVLLAAGTPVGASGISLPAGARIGAGARLPVSLTLGSLTWPKGSVLPVAMTQQGAKDLPIGALIPSGTNVKLAEGTVEIPLRAAGDDKVQGRNWALAQMLPDGSQSWSMRLVAGADIEAADSRQVVPGNPHAIVLADTHYTAVKTYGPAPGKWVWAPGNSWGEPEGQEVTDPEYLEYCKLDGACIQEPSGTPDKWVWVPGNSWGEPEGQEVTDPEYIEYCQLDGACVLVPGQPGPQRLLTSTPAAPALSVVRTGTGNLELLASGDISMRSPYGVYTAGTSTSTGDAALDAAFNQARGKASSATTVLFNGKNEAVAPYEALVDGGAASLYRAWYPDGGGNLRVDSGGNLTGDAWAAREQDTSTSNVGNWLWRQGTGSAGAIAYQPAAWWTNFGSYTYDPLNRLSTSTASMPSQTGFVGFGTLGGGNAIIRVAGDAGMTVRLRQEVSAGEVTTRSQAINLAVGSTGRVLPGGEILQTGGGDLDVQIGGGWNASNTALPLDASGVAAMRNSEVNGGLVNLRGAVDLMAGQIGSMEMIYLGRSSSLSATRDPRDVRAVEPYTATRSQALGGVTVVPGDSSVSINSRGDLVLAGTGDAGRVRTGNYQAYDGVAGSGEAGASWFTLWTDATALKAVSAGGNLAPDTRSTQTALGGGAGFVADGGWMMLPGSFQAAALHGSIFAGQSAAFAAAEVGGRIGESGGSLVAPQGARSLQLLAGQSIYAAGYGMTVSAADSAVLATPLQPAFAGYGNGGFELSSNLPAITALHSAAEFPSMVFGLNTASSRVGSSVQRFYAAAGDIVGLQTGLMLTPPASGARAGQIDYVGAGPITVRAGRDIVNAGFRRDDADVSSAMFYADQRMTLGGNLIVHNDSNDVSVIAAGRDILYANWTVAGPGLLDISAGRNIVQEDLANIVSLGAVLPGDSRPGAGIVLQAGMGPGADYVGYLARYIDPLNRALASTPLADQPGKVAYTYEAELQAWLSQRYGFSGTDAEAAAYLAGLPREQQSIFAREIFFLELRAGGREYNDNSGPRPGSYLRGRNAIAALFPAQPGVYGGDLLMFGAAGVHTNQGGVIQVLTPGGAQTYGIEGPQPPSSAGLITRGSGDIQLYALGSILLGQSRVMTTFGGNIMAWSAQGDINAGRGSKTTLIYTPPRRVYDDLGNASLSANVPSTGAGIATLAPLPEVAAGDVDLVAPLGTIDAGEAGIRFSGNVNVAALQVVNAANIRGEGQASGIPVLAAVNVGALSSASTAASAAANAASDTVRQQQAAARQNQSSIFSVQILGYGGEPVSAAPAPGSIRAAAYGGASSVQVLGNGSLDASARTRLTERERANLAE